jgi:uncharacterized metal-binding protein YceD (DUF177 family)
MRHVEPPFERVYDLGGLGRAGDGLTIALNEESRARLAKWADIEAVDKYEAAVSLRRLSANRFEYQARLVADIVQSCVVTLEPVNSHIEREFSRELHFQEHSPRSEPHAEALTIAAADDEAPEEIESLEFDVAKPLLEEFCLSIDPYPRAPGVAFAPPATHEPASESPFAALKSLKVRR